MLNDDTIKEFIAAVNKLNLAANKEAEQIANELKEFTSNCTTLIESLYTLYDNLSEDARRFGGIGLVAGLETLGGKDVSCVLGGESAVKRTMCNLVTEIEELTKSK